MPRIPPASPIPTMLGLGLAFGLCRCQTPEGPVAAVPQRPTVSSDTGTTAAGTFELEAGLSVDRGDFLDTPTTLKFGASETTELFLGWSPHQVVDRAGPDGRGSSDVVIGTRTRLVEQQGELQPSLAVQLRSKLPTASTREGLSSGELDTFAAFIATRSVGTGALTGYYELGALGEEMDGFDVQHTLALAGGVPLGERLSAFSEVAGSWVHEQDRRSHLWTTGLAFSPAPDLVLDSAVVIGLNDDAPDLQFVVGFTLNFARIAQALGGRRDR